MWAPIRKHPGRGAVLVPIRKHPGEGAYMQPIRKRPREWGVSDRVLCVRCARLLCGCGRVGPNTCGALAERAHKGRIRPPPTTRAILGVRGGGVRLPCPGAVEVTRGCGALRALRSPVACLCARSAPPMLAGGLVHREWPTARPQQAQRGGGGLGVGARWRWRGKGKNWGWLTLAGGAEKLGLRGPRGGCSPLARGGPITGHVTPFTHGRHNAIAKAHMQFRGYPRGGTPAHTPGGYLRLIARRVIGSHAQWVIS